MVDGGSLREDRRWSGALRACSTSFLGSMPSLSNLPVCESVSTLPLVMLSSSAPVLSSPANYV